MSNGLNYDPTADSEQLKVVVVVEIVKVSLSRTLGTRYLSNPSRKPKRKKCLEDAAPSLGKPSAAGEVHVIPTRLLTP